MEETQAIDFDDLPSDEGPLQLDIHQVAGELQTVSEPADRLPLYLGLNVVGRGSSQADQEVMLNKWKADFSGMPVHGVFLQNNSISSTHAVIYLESAGAVCWIKDTGSRNKTLLGRAGGLTVLQSKGDRYSVLPGDKLRFGTVDTIITYSTTYDQADTAGGVQPGSDHGYSSHATEGQQHVSRSPTPDMAAAQVPSAPAAATDNDMTLPWDDPLDEQPELRHKSSPGNAAVNSETEVHEPSHAAEQPMTEAPILPDTQANDPPDDTGAGLRKLSTGPQDLAFAEPTQLVDAPTHLMGEPTQLMGEPTELAVPAHPAAAAPSAAPGSQAGTALASAAAQAMTGAHPSQASALPSSGGFPTAMPSLADPPPAPAPSPAGSALAQNSGPVQGMSKSLPMSGPEADAVLHLPSQPSGSQHAAHPHGPPRTHEAGSSAASKPGSDTQNQQAGAGEQSHHDQTQQGVAGSHRVQGDSAAAGAGSSDHNTLLDSVLGHDDDDSIWMPPASLPESEGGPHEGGEDMPLQLQAPTAGAAEGSAPAAVSIPPAAQQVSDSDQTQDFPPEAIHADADGTSAPPAATRGPAHQGNAGRALPHAEEGMYTGAFAFPDSASLEVSQPALDLPHKPGKGRPVTAAARPAARGKAAKAAAAAKAGKEPAVQGKGTAAEAGKKSASAVRDDSADVAKDASSAGAGAGGGASAGASPKGRVMPSGWKKKKAEPVADGHADSAAEEAAEAAGPSAELPAGALQDQGPHVAAQKEEAAPSSTHIAHGAGKPTPWRVRGTPLGVGPAGGPSQLPNSEDINAAMAAAGDLAACFPSTQAEQEVDASLHAHTTLEPRSNTGTTAAGAAAAAPPSKSVAAAAVTEKSNPAATRKEQDGVQGITAAAPQQPSASTDAEHGHDPKAASQSGHTSAEAEQQQGASAEADSRSADEASHGQPDEAEDVQSHRGAGQRQTSRRKQVGRAAVDEEEEEDHGSAGVRGRGRGSRGKGRGRGQARGRKRSSPDAETEEDATKVGKPQVKAAKGKEGRSRDSREASPALQPTRVSKRQKAKAEAQAADAAQQEEEEDHNPEDDTFFGAATQAAAGILEDLRRSATPDEDADMHEAAEAGPPVPALQPSMKGRRSTAKRTAHAAPAADPKPAVAAAEAPAQDHAVPDSQVSGKSSRPKRRASPQSKAAAGSRGKDTLPGQEDSAGGSNAAASTAAAQSTGHDSTAAGGASEGQEEGSVPVKRGQKRRAGADSTGQGRRKSRLSKASSPAPDPSLVADDPSETLAKLLGPARRGDLAKQLQAEKQQKTDDRVSSAPKRKSGMGSTAVKAQGAAAHGTAPEQGKEAAGSGSGSLEEAVEDRAAGTSKASSSRGKAKRKSAPTRGDDEQPPAEAAGGRRGSNGSQSASKQAAAASTAHVAADESGGNAVASKAKQAPRAKQLAARRHSQATSAAAVAKEEAQPSGGRRRGPQAKASTARAASQSQDAAAEGNGQEEERNEDEDEADPPVRQPGGDSAAAGKGAQAKGKAVRGKRSRQSMEEDAAADVGPAGHVKAARKATDSKPVRVLYSTALDKAKKSSMTKVIKRLGGSVEDAEGPDFTHFVALQPTAANQTDRGFKKSINALIALAAGRPIVSESWVEACNRSSSFVDALDHLLIDKAAQKKYGFDLRTSYERAQHQLLLSGLHIFFTPGALAGESDGGTNIQNLVEHAGGVVEKQLPKSASSKDSEVWSQWLLVGSENDKNKDQKMCRKQFAAGLTFHGRSMLIDSIMQQSLDRKHGVLFTT